MTERINLLNDEQLAAIDAEGSVLLIACPGSGKTRTLIHKIARELSEIKSHRRFVVALTYTHVAADEIRERISDLGVSVDQLWVGTIHSFCLEWIIRPYSIYHESLAGGFTVLDTFDQEELLDKIAKKHGLKGRYDCAHYATSTGYKVDQKVPGERRTKVKAVVDQYHEELTEMRAIDFEMMLKYSLELIQSHSPIAKRLSRLFPLIAVDEYQDTREIQYQILSKIFLASKSETRLFMVGDPNQAIYTSLGGMAMPLGELTDLTGLEIEEMHLKSNYRSSQQIVDYFKTFGVKPVDIVSAGDFKDWQGDLTYNNSVHRDFLIDHVAKLVLHNIENLHVAPSEICVVAPWWIHLSSMTRALVERLPNYQFNGPGLTPFGENRDNFWYKVARIALTEASPNHYFTRLWWAKEIVDVLVDNRFVSAELDAREFLKTTNSIFPKGSDGVLYLKSFFEVLIEKLSIELREEDELQQQRKSFFERMENRLTRIHSTEKVNVNDLHTFRRVFRPRSGIVVSTVHGVKGAEFDTIIAFALYEGAIPHFSEIGDESSAKRSLFVISSRARKNLHLISERGRLDYRKEEHAPTRVLALTKYGYTATVV